MGKKNPHLTMFPPVLVRVVRSVILDKNNMCSVNSIFHTAPPRPPPGSPQHPCPRVIHPLVSVKSQYTCVTLLGWASTLVLCQEGRGGTCLLSTCYTLCLQMRTLSLRGPSQPGSHTGGICCLAHF